MFLEIKTTWNLKLYCLISQYTLLVIHCACDCTERKCLSSGCNTLLCLQTGWCHLSLLFLRPIWCLLSTIQSIPYGQDQVFNWWKLSCFSWPCIQSLLANIESHAKHIFSSVQTSMCLTLQLKLIDWLNCLRWLKEKVNIKYIFVMFYKLVIPNL